MAGEGGEGVVGGPGPCRGQPAAWVGGPAQAAASLQSPDSRKSGCFLPMFRVSPKTIPVWVSCRMSSGHTGVVLRLCPQSLKEEASRCPLGGSRGGSRAWAHLVALHLVAACGSCVPGAGRSLPWSEKGHSSA